MFDHLDNELFRSILRGTFERKVKGLNDTFSLTCYYLRVSFFIAKVQSYYTTEQIGARKAILEEVNGLILSKPLEFEETDIMEYLIEVRDDLTAGLESNGEIEWKADNPWSEVALTEASIHIDGMLYPDTMKYYKWLGEHVDGDGVFVELGPWMGKSTYCLAEGISKNPSGIKNLHVFDRFLWEGWMGTFMESSEGYGLGEGDSFLDLFISNNKPFLDLISINETDIFSVEAAWNKEPILVFVYDISHEGDLLEAVWPKFEPAFIPNKTLIVFNQFGNARSEHLRKFCRINREQLKAVHKINGAAKTFLYLGQGDGPIKFVRG